MFFADGRQADLIVVHAIRIEPDGRANVQFAQMDFNDPSTPGTLDEGVREAIKASLDDKSTSVSERNPLEFIQENVDTAARIAPKVRLIIDDVRAMLLGGKR